MQPFAGQALGGLGVCLKQRYLKALASMGEGTKTSHRSGADDRYVVAWCSQAAYGNSLRPVRRRQPHRHESTRPVTQPSCSGRGNPDAATKPGQSRRIARIAFNLVVAETLLMQES